MSSVHRAHHKLFWQLQVGGWLLVVPAATGFALMAFDDTETILLTGVFRQVLSFALTCVLWRFYRRWPPETFRLAPHVGTIALACIVVTAIDVAIVETVRAAVDLPPAPQLAERGSAPFRLLLYIMWTSLYFVIRQDLEARTRGLRLAQAELAAREAELSTLRAQVNPHFIFNALNSILAECDQAPAARAITHALADYLRASLLQREHHAPLGDEVDSIAAYLSVEKARFETKLAYSFDVEPAARSVRAPIAVLLPMVENAVKYGMRTSPPPLRIEITAKIRHSRLELVVENSGRWVEPGSGAFDSTQIGLANLRRRLALLHGDDALLSIDHDNERVRVTVSLPVAGSSAV